MIGSVRSRRDSSFLCLSAIYAAHLVLFHVLGVAPRAPRILVGAASTEHNATTVLERRDALEGTTAGPSQIRHEVFTTSQLHWDSLHTEQDPLTSYPKIDFRVYYLFTWIQHMKNVLATIAPSASTWGIISGCAIFLLTYTDRDNTLQI